MASNIHRKWKVEKEQENLTKTNFIWAFSFGDVIWQKVSELSRGNFLHCLTPIRRLHTFFRLKLEIIPMWGRFGRCVRKAVKVSKSTARNSQLSYMLVCGAVKQMRNWETFKSFIVFLLVLREFLLFFFIDKNGKEDFWIVGKVDSESDFASIDWELRIEIKKRVNVEWEWIEKLPIG